MTRRLPNPTHPSGDNHWTRRRPELLKRGTASPFAKLNARDIENLCAWHKTGNYSQNWLARHFRVTRTTVWRHLKAHDRESLET